MAPYPYRPLTFPAETRILTISPGLYDEDVVECSMSHISLSRQTEPYDALSYCWSKSVAVDNEPDYSAIITYAVHGEGVSMSGEAEFRALNNIPHMKSHYVAAGGVLPAGIVRCDGVEMKDGGELYSAIKRLRKQQEPLRIWIDALCINQDDTDEKNRQVKLMTSIYAGATTVRIWLGERIGNEPEAIEALESIVDILNDACEAVGSDNPSLLDIEFRVRRDKRVGRLAWETLDRFLDRAWFQRIWVIQEVAYAREAIAHIGEYTFSWSWLSSIVTMARKYKMDSVLNSYSINSICTMGFVGGCREEGQPIELPLIEVLEETRTFRSTLTIDKVYGILGLVEERRNIVVDYSLQGPDLFKRLALECLTMKRSLDMLYHCVYPRKPSLLKLPSWVADWTAPGFVEPLISRRLAANACGATKARLTIDDGKKLLSIWGRKIDVLLVVDSVKEIPAARVPQGSQPWGVAAVVEDQGDIERETFGACNASHRNNARFQHGDTNTRDALESVLALACCEKMHTGADALLRTLICNSTPDGQRPDGCETRLGFGVYLSIVRDGLTFPDALDAAIKHCRERYGIEENGENRCRNEAQKAFEMFARAHGRWTYNRRFFRTMSDHYGWGVEGVRPGDVVVVFLGGRYPFVLREQESGNFTIMGDCYLDGFMDGEGLTDNFPEEVFRIE